MRTRTPYPASMRCIVLRHGKASQESPTGRDADRDLLPKGVRQSRFIAERLASLDLPPALAISSPYTRAQRTAELAIDSIECAIELDDRLTPDMPASGALDVAHAHRERLAPGAPLLLVGHNPIFENLAGWLLRAPVRLRTGEALDLEIDFAAPRTSARLLTAWRLEE